MALYQFSKTNIAALQLRLAFMPKVRRDARVLVCRLRADRMAQLERIRTPRHWRYRTERSDVVRCARFKDLGERLEALKERHEQGLLTSVEFLKELLNLARDVVSAERAAPPIEREEQGKAALTQLFEEARNPETPIIVERVVNDIDEIVRIVRFDGWQSTHAGEREVKLALRKTLFKYRLHQDQELFDRAYGYIREYY